MPSFLSQLFGGSDEHEKDAEAAEPTATAAVQPRPAPAAPKIARAAIAARAADKPDPRRERIGAIPTPAARPAKTEGYQVASAGSTPIKSAGFEMASATSTPVKLERLQLAQAGSPIAVPGERAAPAPVRPAQAASLVGRANAPANAASANDVI